MADLVTLEEATAALPPLNAQGLADLPGAISAASAAAEAWCGRPLSPRPCSEEIVPPMGSRVLDLGARPVLAVARVATRPRPALSVSYAGTGYARASLSWPAEVLPHSAPPGSITLTTFAGGLPSPVEVSLQECPTLGLLASAVNALDDWSAEVLGDSAELPSSWMRHPKGAMATSGPGSIFLGYLDDLRDYDLDTRAGSILLGGGDLQGGGLGAGLSGAQGPAYSFPDARWGGSPRQSSYLVEYTAGLVVTPPDVKRAVCLIIRAMAQAIALTMGSTQVRIGDLSKMTASFGAPPGVLPPGATELLAPYRMVQVF